MAKRKSKWVSSSKQIAIESVEIVDGDIINPKSFVLINGVYHGRVADAQKWADAYLSIVRVSISRLKFVPAGWSDYEYIVLKD